MKGILFAKLKLFLRKPWLFVIMTGVCVMFAFFTSQGEVNKIPIPYSVVGDSEEMDRIVDELKGAEAFQFQEMTEEQLKEYVSEGERQSGLILMPDDFRIMISSNTGTTSLLQQVVGKAYSDMKYKKAVEEAALSEGIPSAEVSGWFHEAETAPVFSIKEASFKGDDTFVYDPKLQSLFGFSLFFVIYTIAFNVSTILNEKNEGVWDRIILSPTRKWEMYAGNLVHSFILGYVQLALIFFVFRYITDVNFYGNFTTVLLLLVPYVFTIVSLSMLITGIVKKVQHFSAVIPIVAVSMAMIGGAFWPLEIVKSPILLGISKVVPITYGMEALKGATINGWGTEQLMLPVSVLILMGVLMMGIGINFMERRHV
ncbi:ABC transporter permease [Rossellomorea aquimaris]|uniref:ABC transporter permease n=1 Tax=Rossellomorea aquimaris TaxID=189382 RepID=UPI001CD7F485|nr:ABC transporter permease [Rossellomorea aquimaris]MCA1057058.1 ABC transporter permease [Rossellomorea aquimaris]